ncbi:MAG: diacylglycerol/lipid kinase family protein [Bryobacteraceae bacterium]
MSHISLIYNPTAGLLRRRPELAQRAAEWLSPLGEVRLALTTGPETAGPLAAEAVENGAKLVVAFGGDGTVNEVANGLIGSPVPLGVLPGGTANVLCVETGLGTNPEKAARRLVSESEPVRIAVGKMTRPDGFSRHFLIMAGIGLDAIVVDEVNAELKKRVGKVAYWISGISMFARTLPQFQFALAGASSQRSFVLASRVRNYGGDLEIAKRVSLLEPCFETVAFEGVNSLRYLPYLAGVLAGQVGRLTGVAVAPAMELACRPVNGDRVPVQLDGELAGHLPAEFHMVPDALTLLAPTKYVRRAKEHRWITSPIR